jgi:hypothetical protein
VPVASNSAEPPTAVVAIVSMGSSPAPPPCTVMGTDAPVVVASGFPSSSHKMVGEAVQGAKPDAPPFWVAICVARA